MLATRLGKHLAFSEFEKAYTLEKKRLQMDEKNTGKEILANRQHGKIIYKLNLVYTYLD